MFTKNDEPKRSSKCVTPFINEGAITESLLGTQSETTNETVTIKV